MYLRSLIEKVSRKLSKSTALTAAAVTGFRQIKKEEEEREKNFTQTRRKENYQINNEIRRGF